MSSPLSIRLAAGLALALLSLGGAARAQSAPTVRPEKVAIGIYVLDLYNLDFKNNNYEADFYLWMRWEGKFNPEGIEFRNGVDIEKDVTDRRMIRGVHYAAYRCQGQFHDSFNLRNYPLDEHLLTIEVEDKTLEADELMFVADDENIRVDRQVRLGGWEIGAPRPVVRAVSHVTNYGIPFRRPDETAVYSRFCLNMPIQRAGAGIYLKSFLALFISVAIAFLAPLIPAGDLQSRLGAGLAGLFGVVASLVVVAQNLPETPHFTLADRLHIVSLFFVFLSVLQSCLVHRLDLQDNRQAQAARIDRGVGAALPLVFAAIVMVLSLRAA